MKKLMIALVAVAVATCAQAASFSWKTSATGKVYTPGDSSTLLASATAYLFDSSAVTQASLVEAFAAGTLDLSSKSYLSSQAISSGAIAAKSFEDSTAVGDYLNSYFAAIVTVDSKDYLFVSGVTSAMGQEGKTNTIQFNAKAASSASPLDSGEGYSAAGWYAAASAPTPGPSDVPEPTTGLLMLLGVAGLALRRRA